MRRVIKTMMDECRNLYIVRGDTILKLKAKKATYSSHINYSIPVNYGDQVPIFIEIEADTSAKITSYSIIDDKNLPNRFIKFNIDSLKKNEKITIHFAYWVLIKNHNYHDIPKNATIPKEHELPENAKRWLVSTKAIQSDNLLIKAKAKVLRGFNNNLLINAKKIIISISYNRPILSSVRGLLESKTILRDTFLPAKYWTGLQDAFSSLLFGGLCVNKVNLGVAILRANGIPARVMIVNPVFRPKIDVEWLDSLHYAMEFYMPKYGWVRAEPGRILRQPKNWIVIRIIYPEEENIAGNGLSHYGGKAPWFWFSDDNILLDFPEDLIDYYKKPKGSGVPATSRNLLNKLKVKKEITDDVFKLAQNNWELYVKFFGKKMCPKSSNNYNVATEFQKQGLKCLINSDIDSYLKNIEKSYNIFRKITA